MFCQKCGKELPDGSIACNFCGEKTVPSAPPVVPVKSETPLSKVFEWAMAFGILGAILGLLGGFGGLIVGFIVFLIIGFIVSYAGASVYDLLFRK